MVDTTVEFGLLLGASAPVCTYKAGDVIFREGDPAKELFVVKSGSANVGYLKFTPDPTWNPF